MQKFYIGLGRFVFTVVLYEVGTAAIKTVDKRLRNKVKEKKEAA